MTPNPIAEKGTGSPALRSRTADAPAGRRWPVRFILVAVVFALVLPGLVFCGVLLSRIASSERARSIETAQAAALRTAETLDREIGYLQSALVALGTSPALDSGDLAAFTEQSRHVAASLGHAIVMSDPAGQQLMNSRTPTPSPLPRMGDLETVQRVVATGRPAVSGLFRSPSNGMPSLAIMIPVLRANHVIAILGTNLRPETISQVLRDQNLPTGWTASVTDANDTLFARTTQDERYLGQLVRPDFRRNAIGDHAVWTGTSIEGVPILAAMQRVHLADWRVAVGVPLSVVDTPLRSTILLLAIAGAVALVTAVVLAWRLADSVAIPLRRLALAGDALVNGQPVLGVSSKIAEVDAVSRALVQATRDLRARADALATERAQLAAIIETVPVGLAIAEAPTGRIVSGNSHLERMLRHKLRHSASTAEYGEWTARHADGSLVNGEDFPLARALAGEDNPQMQCIYQRGDGTPLWVQLVAAPIRGTDNQIRGAVVAVLDIDEAVRARDAKARFADNLECEVADRTAALEEANQRLRDEIKARAAAEEQLRQAQKMEAVGQLTGGIAHDFNNLLTIVVGSLDLLRRRLPDGPDRDRYRRLLDNALEGAGRAATLTARLLAFSRRQPLLPQPVDANRLVSGMVDLLHRTLGESVQVETVLAGGLWQTHVDPNQLENALLNLAVNARDAMAPDGGLLTIETGNTLLDQAAAAKAELEPGDYVRLAITDTGSGMPPDLAARVFEPFFTTKPPGQGTGLGLSQVHGFVKQSGGHVTIRTAPGEGTTVTIELPRFQGTTPDTAEPMPGGQTADRPGPPLGSLTVLVVEDEAGVRRYSTEAMRELGHTVLEAADPTTALRLLDAHPEVTLLFTDVVLPQMDGTQLAAEARRRRPGLTVLFTSGYTGDNGAAPSLGTHLDTSDLLLTKPFTLEELATRVRDAVTAVRA
jgi:signal transduction histidine kinase